MIKYVYTVFLGLLIAIFVGVGISVFYTQPTMPNYPNQLNTYPEKTLTEEQARQNDELQKQYDTEYQAWNDKMETYNRNVSIIALLFSVALVALSFVLLRKSEIIANGVMLGGVFTLVYSLIRGFMSMNTKYSFAAVTVALILAIVIGYTRIVAPHEAKAKKA